MPKTWLNRSEHFSKPGDNKICSDCLINKPIIEFHKRGDGLGYKHACKDCRHEKRKIEYRLKREKYIIVNKQWIEDNYEQHLENARVASSTRRALKRGVKHLGNFTKEQWLFLCNRANNICLKCGLKKKLTVDHVLPLIKGGTNRIENIQPLCKPCNSSKNKKEIDYRPWLECGSILEFC